MLRQANKISMCDESFRGVLPSRKPEGSLGSARWFKLSRQNLMALEESLQDPFNGRQMRWKLQAVRYRKWRDFAQSPSSQCSVPSQCSIPFSIQSLFNTQSFHSAQSLLAALKYHHSTSSSPNPKSRNELRSCH